MAIIGELVEDSGRKMIAVGRLTIDPDWESGEFAIVVGDPWQGLGLGTKLVDAVIGIAGDRKLSSVHALIQADNQRMIHLCRKLGFKVENVDATTARATLELS